jgi:hypothetical protein
VKVLGSIVVPGPGVAGGVTGVSGGGVGEGLLVVGWVGTVVVVVVVPLGAAVTGPGPDVVESGCAAASSLAAGTVS